VVRGGYGIYSVREDIGGVDNMAFSAPFYPIVIGGVAPGQNMGNFFASPAVPTLGEVSPAFVPIPSFFTGFGGGSPNTSSPVFSGNAINYFFVSVPLHWIVPTTQQWNLTVQRELGGNWALEVGYVGSKGTHLRSAFDPEQATLATAANPLTVKAQNGTAYTITQSTQANLNARAPYLGINPEAAEAFWPNSDSHYDGLQLTVSHRFSKGLYFQSAYTWSKSIDDVSTASVAFLTRFNDQTDARASRGLSDFDRRQRSVTSFNYAMPFLKERNDFVGHTLGGWEAGSVIVLQSGSPITIVDGAGGTSYRLSSADAVTATVNRSAGFTGCGSNSLTHGNRAAKVANWVNPAAFLQDPIVSVDGSTGYGDAPRNCLIGPGQANVDFTLAKTFRIGEKQSLRFRTEFFNLFNHPTFANPLITGTANVQSGITPQTVYPEAGTAVGQITSTAGTPRLIQFSLKYSF